MNIKNIFSIVFLLFLAGTHILQAQDQKDSELDSIRQVAIIQIQSDSYFESLKTIETLRDIAEYRGNESYIAISEHFLALAYTQFYAYTKAEAHYLKAIELNTKLKDTNALSNNYNNLLHVFMLANEFDSYYSILNKTKELDKITGSDSVFYILESEVMALYRLGKFDSLNLKARQALSTLEKSNIAEVVDPVYKDEELKNIIYNRLQITFEMYLAYGLVEQNEELEYANKLLNKLKKIKLEEVLWFSPRVYEQYYRINRYKEKYFLRRKPVALDSIAHYQKKATFYFNKTINLLKEKSEINNDFLVKAMRNEREMEHLAITTASKEKESVFIRRINYLLAFLGIMALIFVFYYKHSNTQKGKMNLKLQEVLESRNKFLAVISHEIRTPLYALQELIEDTPKYFDEVESEELYLANYSIINLKHAVDNSLQYSRLNFFEGKIAVNTRPANIKNILIEIKDQFRPILGINGVELHLSIQATNCTFNVANAKLNMVLHNIIKNAIEKDDVSEVVVKVEEKIISEKRSILKFSVLDDGRAMEQEMIDYVAKEEIQIKDENSQKGIKMGLILSNQILRLFNSSLVFNPIDNENSVSFDLDLGVSAERTVSILEPINKLRKKILYVDDDRINLLVTKRILESLNLDCVTLDNGYLAIEKVKESNFDLILMDINMPKIDGFETSIAIRKLNTSIPIIAYTALSEDEIFDRCKEAQMTEILTKPLNTNQFKKFMHEFFALKTTEA